MTFDTLRSRRAETAVRYYAFAVFSLAFAAFCLMLGLYGIKSFFAQWLIYPIALLMILWLVAGWYKKSCIYMLGLGIIAWFLLTRLVLGDLQNEKLIPFLIEFCLVFGVALPFASATGDFDKKRYLCGLMLAFVLVMTVGAVLGVYAALFDTEVSVFGTFVCNMSQYDRLQILGQNPVLVSDLLMLSLIMTLYLALCCGRRAVRISALISALLQFCAFVLSDSRGGVLSFLLASAIFCAILAGRYYRKKGRVIVVLLAAFLGLAVCYGAIRVTGFAMNEIASRIQQSGEDVPSEETEDEEEAEDEEDEADYEEDHANVQNNRLSSVSGLSGRETIYANVLQYLKDHPNVLAFGAKIKMIKLMTTNGGSEGTLYQTLHCSYLQTLALLGLPGFLLMMALCFLLLLRVLRILFYSQALLSDKVLCVLLIPQAVNALIDDYIFVPYDAFANSGVTNILFFLFAGYVAAIGSRLPKRKNSHG